MTFEQRLHWTRRHMPRTARALGSLPDLREVRLACSIHIDIKIAPLIEGLLDKSAEVFLVTCNPDTVRDEVVEYLNEKGAAVQAWRGISPAASREAFSAALSWKPTHLCEFGADLSAALHQRNEDSTVSAGLEGTGSGVARLSGLSVRYPVFNWDDLPVKEGLHNRHMVGLTIWHTFFTRTWLTLHEKQVVVVGYGLVGQGVAASARAYGGAVTVVERDPGRALQARFDGLQVLPMEAALSRADVLVTCTGAANVLRKEHFALLKEGVFLLNGGHHNDELDTVALRTYPHREALPYVEEIDLGERRVYLFAGGSMANLTAGEGDSLNAFDLTLAILTAGIGFISSAGSNYAPGLHLLPHSVWEPNLPA